MMSRFIEVDASVITNKALSAINKVVFILLCAYADEKTHTCNLNVATIAEKAGCCINSVYNSLNILDGYGFIEIHTRRSVNGRTTKSSYQIIRGIES